MIGKLNLVEIGVNTVFLQKFLVRADFHNAALLHHNDAIGPFNG